MKQTRTSLSTIFTLTLATLLSAAGVYFFRLPNHFSTGGASGIAIILGEVIPGISSSTFTSILNLMFVVLGFAVLGRSFGWRAAYCSILFSVFLQLFEWLIPLTIPLTDQRLLELIFAAILPATGSALLFNKDSSTGGTEVLALILKKFTALDTGRALLCVDIFFTLSTFLLFDFETGLYSSLGLFIKSTFIDSILSEINRKKAVFVITDYPDPILDYIIENMNRSATFWEATGAYSKYQRWIILTVVSRSQAVRLRSFVRSVDSHAFIISENSSEIYGKGFLNF